MKTTVFLLAFLSTGMLSPISIAQEDVEGIQVTECLMIGSLGRAGRSPVHTDALESRIVGGQWRPPKAGEVVTLPDGKKVVWKAVKAGKKGRFSTGKFTGGYAYAAVTLDEEDTWVLEARGNSSVYVNGEIRAGDPYATGWMQLPVELAEGENHLLFKIGRRPFSARLWQPGSPVFFNTRDLTLPDAIAGEEIDTEGAVVVVNATSGILRSCQVTVHVEGGEPEQRPVPVIPPMSARKIAFPLVAPAPAEGKALKVDLTLHRRYGRRGAKLADSTEVSLEILKPGAPRCRAFRSRIDGSVQVYAVNPADASGKNPALVLSCHGAGVNALGQARSYSRKKWCHLVAPTNRRPFGFDWEDWGRLDALEVLERTQKELAVDPKRIYLTGHSMGGHGAWHLSATFPDRFAAVGPSAGWISFWSYTGARSFKGKAGVESLLMRASSPSRTLGLLRNLSSLGVYILHGDRDDNVPVGQARQMKKHLAAFHRNFKVHEQPGAGHWWDDDRKRPGVGCVDWPPMFDFFRAHTLTGGAEVREVDFLTASPGVSPHCHWVTVEAQQRWLEVSRVEVRFDPGSRTFSGTTRNVSRLALDLGPWTPAEPGGFYAVHLDGGEIEKLAWPGGADKKIHLARKSGGAWAVIPAPSPALKGPHRYGPFKEVFRNRMVFVYATDGTEEENAWALARARYDAETFGYRGNGSVSVVADAAFDPDTHTDRNLVLYGNADCHLLWEDLVGTSPVQVKRGEVRIGDRVEKGDNLACLFLRPRPGSDRALVGVVAGSGMKGMRLTDRLPYFVSGIAYPDVFLIGPEMLTRGIAGVRAAGFFGLDWSVKQGEIAWRKPAD